MKILHIITRLDRGGSTEDLLHNCIYLSGKGYNNTILYGKTLNPSNLLEKIEKENITFINIPYMIREINFAFDLLAFLLLIKVIKNEQPDIIHTRTSKAGILGRWAGWIYKILYKKNIKIFHSTHGHIFYGYYNTFVSFIFTLAEKITALITDKIIVLTENEITEHLRYGIGQKNQFCVIHSGIDYKIAPDKPGLLKEKLNIPEGALIIGSAGRLEPVKGYIYFIKAIKQIEAEKKKYNVKYLVIGDGTEREKLVNKTIEYGLSGKVIFAGWQDDIENYISIIDIYVQPSLNEGFGITIIQAQLLSKPVIATRVQGIVSLIKNMETGIIVNPRNPSEIRENIIKLIEDEKLRRDIGINANKHVSQKNTVSGLPIYSIESMNQLIEKLYAIF